MTFVIKIINFLHKLLKIKKMMTFIKMCGIWIYVNTERKIDLSKMSLLYDKFFQIYKRGPERSKMITLNEQGIMIGFHRLCIMDLSPEYDQPYYLTNDGHMIYTLCNGEIYNYEYLKKKYDIKTNTDNDCEVIQYVYAKVGITGLAQELVSEEASGEYAIVIIDIYENNVTIHAFRDPTGIRPLFMTTDSKSFCLTSEIKGSPHIFSKDNISIAHIHPRTITTYNNNDNLANWEYKLYFNIEPSITNLITDIDFAKNKIRETLTLAVKTRMNADRDIAFLLSGGVDSSLVCSLGATFNKNIHTFSIGLPNGTDEKFAKIVANHINSKHTHVELTEQDFINAVEQVVYVCETYDITTIRATVGQYLISKYISENTNIKVLYIGDGSDELFGSYLYFHKAPSSQSAHEESQRLLNNIHCFDVLRADRGIASNGLEARVPFLDHRLIQLVMNIDPSLRVPINGIEKWILRESFKDTGLLPNEILYRKKEAFSDGVSSKTKSWFEILQGHINKLYTDDEFQTYQKKYTHCMPKTKEALHYRLLFEKHFGSQSEYVVPYFWLPKWCGEIDDPSARVLQI